MGNKYRENLKSHKPNIENAKKFSRQKITHKIAYTTFLIKKKKKVYYNQEASVKIR